MQGLQITPENQEIIYNASDTMQTMALKEAYDAGLLPDWTKTTYEYSEKMLGPIFLMMRRGVRIDTAARDRIVLQLEDRIRKVRATFDTLCASIGALIAGDRTLGGLCDWFEAEAPRPVDLAVEGAAGLKAAVIQVILHYSTADPLA